MFVKLHTKAANLKVWKYFPGARSLLHAAVIMSATSQAQISSHVLFSAFCHFFLGGNGLIDVLLSQPSAGDYLKMEVMLHTARCCVWAQIPHQPTDTSSWLQMWHIWCQECFWLLFSWRFHDKNVCQKAIVFETEWWGWGGVLETVVQNNNSQIKMYKIAQVLWDSPWP